MLVDLKILQNIMINIYKLDALLSWINKCYTVKCSETCIHKKCYSAFHNQTYIYLVYNVIHNIKIWITFHSNAIYYTQLESETSFFQLLMYYRLNVECLFSLLKCAHRILLDIHHQLSTTTNTTVISLLFFRLIYVFKDMYPLSF